MNRRRILTLAPALAAWSIAATAAAQTTPAAPQPPTAAGDNKLPAITAPAATAPATLEGLPNLPSTYVIGVDDTLVIRVGDVPELNDKPQRVDPNGDLRLPVIGRVRAAGASVEQLEAELKQRLSVFLQQPDVTVTVTSSRSQTVSIIGAVTDPGVKQLDTGKTLLEVLSAAGGITVDAGPTVRVGRRLEQGRIPLPEATTDPSGAFSIVDLDAKALLDGRTPAKNIVIQPNDTISVPRADVVYVVGEVSRPGPVILNGGHSISVMEAVSSSGGTLRTAAANRVRILRRSSAPDKRTEIAVNLKKVMNGKADDIAMASGDILVVPNSSGKRATTRALEAAVQMGMMIGTYGIIR